MQFDSATLVQERSKAGCIAAFDFDDTMVLPEFDIDDKIWVHGLQPNPYILKEIFRLTCEGWRAIIITERDNSEYNKHRIHNFCRKYELPIKDVIYTGGDHKAAFLEIANAKLLYDDEPYEIEQLSYFNIVGILVPHPADSMTNKEFMQSIKDSKTDIAKSAIIAASKIAQSVIKQSR